MQNKVFFKTRLRPIFTKMCVFWAKHKTFKLDVGVFPRSKHFFLCSKGLERLNYAKKSETKKHGKKESRRQLFLVQGFFVRIEFT
jgi:hypothetical protein